MPHGDPQNATEGLPPAPEPCAQGEASILLLLPGKKRRFLGQAPLPPANIFIFFIF